MKIEELKINSQKKEKPSLSKESYIKRFHWLRDEHLDDLPDFDVREIPYGDPRCDRFKCQVNFIGGLRNDLKLLLFDKVVDDAVLINKIKEFLRYKFDSSRPTTKEEIGLINDILNDVIDYLEKDNRN
jgi:hypothetical protein